MFFPFFFTNPLPEGETATTGRQGVLVGSGGSCDGGVSSLPPKKFPSIFFDELSSKGPLVTGAGCQVVLEDGGGGGGTKESYPPPQILHTTFFLRNLSRRGCWGDRPPWRARGWEGGGSSPPPKKCGAPHNYLNSYELVTQLGVPPARL